LLLPLRKSNSFYEFDLFRQSVDENKGGKATGSLFFKLGVNETLWFIVSFGCCSCCILIIVDWAAS
jgi:hypothetical protein